MSNKIIFATTNEGKMKEIRMILADLGMEILSLKDLDINVDIEENGKTFEENAIIKELSTNLQTKIKTTIKRTSDLEVKEVNIKVKGIETEKMQNQG